MHLLNLRNILIASLLFTAVQYADAQTISFIANNQQINLIEEPGAFSAGKYADSNNQASAKTIAPMQVGIDSIQEILPGQFLIKTAGTIVSPQSVKQYGGYDYIYPVYKLANRNFKVYPKPEIIVKVRPKTDIQALASKYSMTVLSSLLFTTDQFLLRHSSDISPFKAAKKLRSDRDVLWVNPNLTHSVARNSVPNDPLYPKEWHLNNTGQLGGKDGADVSAEKAWDLVKPNQDLVIAILDGSMDITHPDLNIYTNEAEADGQPGVDDDNNGLVDDIHGWNFVANNNNVQPRDGKVPEERHATAAAGVAAAIGNNSLGVSGAAPGVKILPVYAIGNINKDDLIDIFREANAIRYAAKYADILSNSWSDYLFNDTGMEALDFAFSNQSKRGDKQVPVLFSAGNESFDVPEIYFFKSFDLAEGDHTITFEYTKNDSVSAGDDLIQIVTAAFDLSSSKSRITISEDNVETDGDASFETGTFINGGREYPCFQSGKISDNQSTRLIWSFSLEQAQKCALTLGFLASTEKGGDFFHLYADDNEIKEKFEFGNAAFEFPFSGIVPDDYNPAPLDGPCLHPKVFSIGASTDEDIRASYSQWGKELNFVAPSSSGVGDGAGGESKGLYTTDVTGNGRGYDPNSDFTEAYDTQFKGTSAACPLAAGIVAMVISANPDLTRTEIFEILRDTADKIEPYEYDANGFNIYVGYGRLNMYSAVKRAIELIKTPVDRWEVY